MPRPDALRADGGAAANDVLMQLHADITGFPVECANPLEATAYGAAMLAGEACGIWEPWSTAGLHKPTRIFTPTWSQDQREDRFHQWKKACGFIE